MNKFKKYFTIILLFIAILFLFKYNYILQDSVNNAVMLWLNKVFPSLFIMFIINDIIISTHILDNIGNILSPIFNKIYNLDGSSLIAFILSIFSGTPSSAFILKEMIQNKSISLDDANKLISFTFFSNPLFLYNILSLTFNKFITIKIIIVHYVTNLIIGLFFRNKTNNITNNYNIKESKVNTNILILLPQAITKSFNTLLMILGTITFYMIITNLFLNVFSVNLLEEIIIKGLLEITQSLNTLSKLNILSIIKEIIALSLISFGGLSIHTQVLAIINETNIKYKNFLIGRILHALFSTCIYFFITIFFFS